MLTPVQYVIEDGLLNLGLRTEDVKFSPSGRLLAAVATNGSMFIFSINVECRPIQIDQLVELHSHSLRNPHGIDFLNEDEVVVANRGGLLTFYRIPPVEVWNGTHQIDPIHSMPSDWFGAEGVMRQLETRAVLCGPGSVRIHGHQLFVSCNNKNTVTAHSFSHNDGKIEALEGEIIAREGLEIPDGVGLSADGKWMAVSNHHNNSVFVYSLADWTDALRQDLLYHDKIGPDKSIKSLSELDHYQGNTFVSGSNYFLNAMEAKSLIERKREIRYDIVDDVSVGLMFSRHEVLPDFSLCVSPDRSISDIISTIRQSNASHVRLQHFPLDHAKSLWKELKVSEIW